MNNKYLFPVALLTLIGVVGMYIIGGYAYKRYLDYKAQAGSLSGAAGLLGGLWGN